MGWKAIAAALLLYAASFALFYPKLPINTDEAAYLNQAILMSRGQKASFKIHAPSGAVVAQRASDYPVGTAALMAGFVRVGGWRAAYLAPLLALVAGVLLTALWLRDARLSPGFALLVLGFPATLALGRVAMSDVPSLAVVALGLWLFWRGLRGAWLPWLASGFVAGASTVFRESNAIPFVGFFAGAVVRRDRNAWALIVGGLAGVGVRLATSAWAYANPFHFKASSAVFMRHGLLDAVALQALALLVLVPGGLAWAFAYRGERRPELIASVGLFAVFYLAFGYAAVELGFAKRIVLGARFYVPLLPLLALASADVVPRIWQRLLAASSPERALRWRRLGAAAVGAWVAGVATAAIAVHPIFDRFAASQIPIREAIREHAGTDSLVISNLIATVEYLPWVESRFGPIDVVDITPRDASRLAHRYSHAYLILLDKSDSSFWREESQRNADFAERVDPAPALVFDRAVNPKERLRIWRLEP